MDLYMGAWDGRGTGSQGPMRQATELLVKKGAFSTNWFIHTPVCCPSRGEILTGKYYHNIRVAALADGGCMHVDENKVNPVSFARYLEAAGCESPYCETETLGIDATRFILHVKPGVLPMHEMIGCRRVGMVWKAPERVPKHAATWISVSYLQVVRIRGRYRPWWQTWRLR